MTPFLKQCLEVAVLAGHRVEEFTDGSFRLMVDRGAVSWPIHYSPGDGWVLIRTPLLRLSDHAGARRVAMRENLELAFFRYAEEDGLLLLSGEYPEPEFNPEEFLGVVRLGVRALEHSIQVFSLTAPVEA